MTAVDTSVVGIDLGARRAWICRLELDGELPGPPSVTTVEVSEACRFSSHLASASVIAIDAPAGPSEARHAGDERLSPKFQRARCSEVALRRAGIAVPFVTPQATATTPGWMRAGFAVWQLAKDAGAEVLETYPHGVFWRLAGRPLLHKQRPEGRQLRLEALRRVIPLPEEAARWSHDELDATACAVVAWLRVTGNADRIDCADDAEWPSHEPSAVWLPPPGTGASIRQR